MIEFAQIERLLGQKELPEVFTAKDYAAYAGIDMVTAGREMVMFIRKGKAVKVGRVTQPSRNVKSFVNAYSWVEK